MDDLDDMTDYTTAETDALLRGVTGERVRSRKVAALDATEDIVFGTAADLLSHSQQKLAYWTGVVDGLTGRIKA